LRPIRFAGGVREAEFPKVKAAIEARAVDAVTLAAAVVKDKDAAAKQYGVSQPSPAWRRAVAR